MGGGARAGGCIRCNKGSTLMGDVDGGREAAHVWGKGGEEVRTSSLFCCERRTALKKMKSILRNRLE